MENKKAAQQYIYVLQVSGRRFYVGTYPERKNYFSLEDIPSKYHNWLVKYNFRTTQPIAINEIDHNHQLLATVIDFMKMYGTDNVRGGPFHVPSMSLHYKTTIEDIIDCTNTCSVCNQSGHSKPNCQSYKVGAKRAEKQEEKDKDEEEDEISSFSSSSGFSSFFSRQMSSSSSSEDSKDKDYHEGDEDDDDDDDEDYEQSTDGGRKRKCSKRE